MADYKDYYRTLGVERSADEKEIRRAFRKLAAKHHPDRNPGDAGAEDRFKDINEAYTVLSDPEKRKFYDQYGHSSPGNIPQPFHGAAPGMNAEGMGDFSDFFQSLFGGFGGFGGGEGGFTFTSGGFPQGVQPRAPQPVRATLGIDLVTAYRGGPTNISVGGNSLQVTIPAGVQDGQRLRLRGQAPGGADLILELKLENTKQFSLRNGTLRTTVDVPAPRAALGGEIQVHTIGGETLTGNVPAGTSSGRTLRLKGHGWPGKDGAPTGDFLVEIRVTVPSELSEKEHELYETLLGLAT